MNRVVKIIGVIIAVIAVFFIGRCFYMVACISCTIPPIQTYEYKGTEAEFVYAVKEYEKSDTTIKVNFSRRDSTKPDDGFRDVEINMKQDTAAYNFAMTFDPRSNPTEIRLIQAFNKNNRNVGGYGITANGMQQLLSVFKNRFLNPLNRKEHIVLKAE